MKSGSLIDFQEELKGIKSAVGQLRQRQEDSLPEWADEVSAWIEEALEIETIVPGKCRKRLGRIRKWLAKTHFTNNRKEVLRIVETCHDEMEDILNNLPKK